MHGNITGIDIGMDHVTAVQTGSGLKGRRILAFSRVPLDNGDLNEALGSLAGRMDLRDNACLVTIPEGHVSFRNVPMPFRDARKIRQALPFEIESMLPCPVEDLLIDFVMTDSRSGGVLAAAVRRASISEYLEMLQSHGIDPEVLEVRGSPLASWVLKQAGSPENMLLLEVGNRLHTLVLCLNGRIALIRSFTAFPARHTLSGSAHSAIRERDELPPEDREAFFQSLSTAVHNTVHAFLSRAEDRDGPDKLFFTGEGARDPASADLLTRFMGMPAEPVDVAGDKKVRMEGSIAGDWSPELMNSALSLALRNARSEDGFNLRRDEFSRESSYLGLRKKLPKIAIFLFLILSFVAADMMIEYYSLKQEYETLTRETAAIFRQTLPQVTRIIDPVQQLRVSVEEMKRSAASGPGIIPSSTILDLLQEISRRIPRSVHVEVRRMVVDPETVRISGRTDAFNEVDKIKNDLAAAALFGPVNITSANLDRSGNKVQFEITIERKR